MQLKFILTVIDQLIIDKDINSCIYFATVIFFRLIVRNQLVSFCLLIAVLLCFRCPIPYWIGRAGGRASARNT